MSSEELWAGVAVLPTMIAALLLLILLIIHWRPGVSAWVARLDAALAHLVEVVDAAARVVVGLGARVPVCPKCGREAQVLGMRGPVRWLYCGRCEVDAWPEEPVVVADAGGRHE